MPRSNRPSIAFWLMVALFGASVLAGLAKDWQMMNYAIWVWVPLAFFVLIRGTIRMFGRWFRGA
jgi:hypothetical protein